MKMDEHARAWAHELVTGILAEAALPPDQRSSLHWEIVNHLHEAAERHVEARGGSVITMADVHAVVNEMGGREGIRSIFQVDGRIVATPRAGFGKRTGAFLVDAVIALPVVGITFGFLSSLVALGAPVAWSILWPIPFVLWYGYLVASEVRFGATIGKMVFKLKTVMADGRPVTPQAAFLRNIAKAFPALLFVDVLLYLLAFHHDDQRGSDRLADTIVIDHSRPVWSAPLPVTPAPPPMAPSMGAAPHEAYTEAPRER